MCNCKVFCFTVAFLKGGVFLEKDRVRISALLDLYGAALPARQRDVLDLYYNDDLSLAEIAEDTGITRQGVRSALLKGEAFLSGMEESLGFFAKGQRIRSAAEEIARAADAAGDEGLARLSARLLAEI